jgi:SAM-dependent methyltransferase
MRQLDIGPGKHRIPGFETLDVVKWPHVDHVADCRKLPFPNGTFGVVHASHVIEHVPWMDIPALVAEWARVLTPGGALEVWTVNAYKLAKAMVEYEETGVWPGPRLGPGTWKDEWVKGDPYRWVSGRLFCYPKLGRGLADPYWHHALFTPKSLQAAFTTAGLVNVREMDAATERRGSDHKWINMGVRGEKA